MDDPPNDTAEVRLAEGDARMVLLPLHGRVVQRHAKLKVVALIRRLPEVRSIGETDQENDVLFCSKLMKLQMALVFVGFSHLLASVTWGAVIKDDNPLVGPPVWIPRRNFQQNQLATTQRNACATK